MCLHGRLMKSSRSFLKGFLKAYRGLIKFCTRLMETEGISRVNDGFNSFTEGLPDGS